MHIVRGFFDIRVPLRALGSFFWARKIYWLVPLLAMLVLFLVLIAFGALAGAGPFNYTLF